MLIVEKLLVKNEMRMALLKKKKNRLTDQCQVLLRMENTKVNQEYQECLNLGFQKQV